jgi:hypothetical protein
VADRVRRQMVGADLEVPDWGWFWFERIMRERFHGMFDLYDRVCCWMVWWSRNCNGKLERAGGELWSDLQGDRVRSGEGASVRVWIGVGVANGEPESRTWGGRGRVAATVTAREWGWV